MKIFEIQINNLKSTKTHHIPLHINDYISSLLILILNSSSKTELKLSEMSSSSSSSSILTHTNVGKPQSAGVVFAKGKKKNKLNSIHTHDQIVHSFNFI